MPTYHQFMMRHGEHGVQDLVERLERYEGIRRPANDAMALEDRWNVLMRNFQFQTSAMAA